MEKQKQTQKKDELTFIEKLIKIQKELKAPKSQFNKFGNFHYRSQEDILEALKPLLAKYGMLLNINDEIVQIGERYYVKATAGVTDGENTHTVSAFARESEEKKGMDSSQVTGATSSYARKYALNGLFLIDDTKDADSMNNAKEVEKNTTNLIEVVKQINDCKTLDELKAVWTNNKDLQASEAFKKATENKKKDLMSKEVKNV